MSFELCILTPAGSIIGTFNNPAEANLLYKFAKANKYDVVTRKIDDYAGGKVVLEKRFVENESAYKSGLEPSAEALKGTLFRMEMEATAK